MAENEPLVRVHFWFEFNKDKTCDYRLTSVKWGGSFLGPSRKWLSKSLRVSVSIKRCWIGVSLCPQDVHHHLSQTGRPQDACGTGQQEARTGRWTFVGAWASTGSGESETFRSIETNQSKQREWNVQKRTVHSWIHFSKDTETNSNLQ